MGPQVDSAQDRDIGVKDYSRPQQRIVWEPCIYFSRNSPLWKVASADKKDWGELDSNQRRFPNRFTVYRFNHSAITPSNPAS